MSSPAPTQDGTLSQADLDAAVSAVPETSDFTYTLALGQRQPLSSTEGTDYEGSGWAASTDVLDPSTGDTVTFRSISRISQHWMQMAEWPPARRKCWLPLETTQAPIGLQALRADRPVPYLLLDELTATEDGYTVPFGLAASLLTVQVTDLVKWKKSLMESTTPVPVDVTVTDGVVTEMKVKAADLLDIHFAPPGVDPAQVEVVRGVDVVMTFADGQSFDADPPKESTIMEPGKNGCSAN